MKLYDEITNYVASQLRRLYNCQRVYLERDKYPIWYITANYMQKAAMKLRIGAFTANLWSEHGKEEQGPCTW
jgi:hypothetical protein